jgi:hypothetical protein
MIEDLCENVKNCIHYIQILEFLDLWIKSYGSLKILKEVWTRWACTRANQQELTTCVKFCGRKKNKKLQGGSLRHSHRRGEKPMVTRQPQHADYGLLFLQFFGFVFFW